MRTLERIKPIIPWNDAWKDNGITVAPRELQTWSTRFSEGGFVGATTSFGGSFDITPIRSMNLKSILVQANRVQNIGNIFTFIPANVTISVGVADNFFTWNLQPQRNNVNATPFDWILQFGANAPKMPVDVILQEGITFNFLIACFDQFAINDQANVFITMEYEQ